MFIQEGKEFDVIVAGAGCAGFCAAVQAGRSGLKVGLFEHFAMPGGSLTVLGSNSIDQFNNPHRPQGKRMVISGIGWEFVKELEKRGFAQIPDMDVLRSLGISSCSSSSPPQAPNPMQSAIAIVAINNVFVFILNYF